MFELREFLKSGFLMAVGKMADYKIILNAAGWFEKDVLTESDLSEIQTAIDDKNARLEAERIAAEEAAKVENVAEETVITEDVEASEDVNANAETDTDIETD